MLRAGAARPPAFTSTQRRQHTTGSSRAAAPPSSSQRRRRVASCDVIDQWEAKQGEHAWLEEVQGDEPSPREEKTPRPRTRSATDGAPTYKKILSVFESKEKIPSVSKIGEHYYNFWTSAENPRGFTKARRVLDEFRKKEPAWEVVLDVDKLGKDEGQSWVYKGSASCREYDSEINPSRAPSHEH